MERPSARPRPRSARAARRRAARSPSSSRRTARRARDRPAGRRERRTRCARWAARSPTPSSPSTGTTRPARSAPTISASSSAPRERCPGRRDARLVPQDLRLEPLELRAGLDAELLDEPCARVLIRVERLRLPARAVERQHELAAERLAERVLANERLELAHDVTVPAELEIRLDPLLVRDESQLLEPADLGLREVARTRTRPAQEPRQSDERLLEQRTPLLGARPSRVPSRTLEPTRVDLLGRDAQHVAGRARLEHVGAELPPEPRDRVLKRGRRRLRRLFAPDEVDEPVGRDHASRIEQQRPRAALAASDRRARPARTRPRPRGGPGSGTRTSAATSVTNTSVLSCAGSQLNTRLPPLAIARPADWTRSALKTRSRTARW